MTGSAGSPSRGTGGVTGSGGSATSGSGGTTGGGNGGVGGTSADAGTQTGQDGAVDAGSGSFTTWPTGSSPSEIGRRVVENYLARAVTSPVRYEEACTWYGSLTFSLLAGDQALDARVIRRFDPILTPAGAAYIGQRDHVDDRVFGIVPLEIYIQNMDARYLTIGQDRADLQWARTTADGITTEARYWVDDMYMITALQAQAFRATGDTKYLDRAATTMVAYLNRLQQPNGLFFHTAQSPQYWGRGNGWFAAGMAEILRSLPTSHPQRAQILAGYQKMMAGLLSFQAPTGMWKQLIDNTSAQNWPETSATGMFAFAMITGVKNGWLAENTYGPAARAAWLALIGYLDANANLREVCVGTGEAFPAVGADTAAQVNYYLARGREVGNFHGQAPVLWSASGLLR
jgi:unsaturated rhamnogalacturonyl hydrolase